MQSGVGGCEEGVGFGSRVGQLRCARSGWVGGGGVEKARPAAQLVQRGSERRGDGILPLSRCLLGGQSNDEWMNKGPTVEVVGEEGEE